MKINLIKREIKYNTIEYPGIDGKMFKVHLPINIIDEIGCIGNIENMSAIWKIVDTSPISKVITEIYED